MQNLRSTEQSINVKSKLYYVSQDYIIQDSSEFNSPILFKRNGGGSPEKVEEILKMCNMVIKSKETNTLYILGVKSDA